MSNKKNVKVSISSIAGEERITQEAHGELYLREDKVYVRYEETSAEMGKTLTMVKIAPGELKIMRSGEVGAEQTFVPGQSRRGWYRAAGGSLPIDIHTRTYTRQLVEGIGRIQWSYDLYVEEEHAGLYTLTLTIQEDVT
ncbi:DUF1934 domain-containing protein [Paenibacillus lutrae]|uniref:DUF1934 family protein n=1 Tax=Paenibacillus lutrae TaxID=2078573 RepID=A0A7X3FMM5_9BACL|nr:DUF1934 domain-containing protein [Paenibacillus lutrae]MVP02534.1 DUF1934 family protein [Paenibacillus lutrae]